MKQALRFSQLSPQQKGLIRLCQTVNFGSILNVRITEGDVSFDPPPEVVIDVRLDEELSARAELELSDFTLCAEVRRLLAQIDVLQNGIIEKIAVHDGIPRRITLRRQLQQSSE